MSTQGPNAQCGFCFPTEAKPTIKIKKTISRICSACQLTFTNPPPAFMSMTTPSPLWCVCRAVRVLMERRSVQTIPALPLLLIVSKLTFSQTKGTWRIDCWWSGYRDELVSVALAFVFEQGLCVCVLHVNSLQSKVILIVFEDVRRRWKRSLKLPLSLSLYLSLSICTYPNTDMCCLQHCVLYRGFCIRDCLHSLWPGVGMCKRTYFQIFIFNSLDPSRTHFLGGHYPKHNGNTLV